MSDVVTSNSLPELMGELRRKARKLLRADWKAQSLEVDALVNSALRRLVPKGGKFDQLVWEDRDHFFAFVYRTMRQVLIDHAIRRKAEKRGGAMRRVAFEEIDFRNLAEAADERPDQVEALFIALERLEKSRPDLAAVFQHRYIAGYTSEEIAQVMGSSPSTVRRDLKLARQTLAREIIDTLEAWCGGR